MGDFNDYLLDRFLLNDSLKLNAIDIQVLEVREDLLLPSNTNNQVAFRINLSQFLECLFLLTVHLEILFAGWQFGASDYEK